MLLWPSGKTVATSLKSLNPPLPPSRVFFSLQGTASSTAGFNETDPPLPVAASFGLMDFDSAGYIPATNFTVVLNLTGAVDGMDYEGLLFDTAGTGIYLQVSPTPDFFSITYTLEGSNSYSAYQNVSIDFSLCIAGARGGARPKSSLILNFFPTLHRLFAVPDTSTTGPNPTTGPREGSPSPSLRSPPLTPTKPLTPEHSHLAW